MIRKLIYMFFLFIILYGCDDYDKKSSYVDERIIYDKSNSNTKKEPLFYLKIYDLDILSNKRDFYRWELENLGLSMNKESEPLCYYFDSLSCYLGPCIFEDENFKVYADCRGEWGGSLYYYDKETTKIHFFECACPKMVTKIGEEYFIIEELWHMGTRSTIYSIADPRNFIIPPLDSIIKTKTHMLTWEENNKLSFQKSQLEAKIVKPSSNLSILLFFSKKNRNFSISADNKLNPVLNETRNQETFLIDSIFSSDLFNLFVAPSCSINGISIYNSWKMRFLNKGTVRIYVKEDTILIGFRKPPSEKELQKDLNELLPPIDLFIIRSGKNCFE